MVGGKIMSGLSDAIAHTQAAATKCGELVAALLSGGITMGDIEAAMVAGLGDTGHLAEAARYQQAVAAQVTGTVQAAQQLKDYLQALVARFQGPR
jgi:hypothetical protein